jgi:hypothetical protein
MHERTCAFADLGGRVGVDGDLGQRPPANARLVRPHVRMAVSPRQQASLFERGREAVLVELCLQLRDEKLMAVENRDDFLVVGAGSHLLMIHVFARRRVSADGHERTIAVQRREGL